MTLAEERDYYRRNYERLREERERAQAAGCALRNHRDLEGALVKMRGERDRLTKTVVNHKAEIASLRAQVEQLELNLASERERAFHAEVEDSEMTP